MADYNINLCTINHTGTHFAFELLEHLYCRNDSVHGNRKELAPLNPAAPHDVIFSHVHYRRNFPMEALNDYMHSLMGTRKTLVTLLHPHRWLVAHISRNEYNPDAISHWHVMMAEVTKYQPTYLDILCPPDRRIDHVTSVIKALGICVPQYDDRISDFCTNKWKKYGSKPTPFSEHFEKTGQLPDVSPFSEQGWPDLDIFVNWYNSQIATLRNNDWIVS